MNVAVEMNDVRRGELVNVSEAGPAPKRIIASFGFWMIASGNIGFQSTPRIVRRLCARNGTIVQYWAQAGF